MALITTNKVSLLILAGGMGSRYKGQKQVASLNDNDETLMEFALYDAIKVGIRKFIFIVNEQFAIEYKNKITSLLSTRDSEVHFVMQTLYKFIPEAYCSKLNFRTKPLGTAHAVLCAKEVIQEPFITMNADDFYGRATFKTAYQYISSGKISKSEFAICAFALENTLSKYGSVSRGICEVVDDKLAQVEELTNIAYVNNNIIGIGESSESRILDAGDKVSMNFWILHPSFFNMATKDLNLFMRKDQDLSKVEFFLPSVIDNAIHEKKVNVAVLSTSEKWFGLTYPGDKELVMQELKYKKSQGVYPYNLWDN